ncbi:MAG: type VI secretion system tip protein VgrG [Deltaproteobacteria bacterium]|jgi:type VI secretion system VgrG family protein|nr:type VI secretion system tip protein VgrG [Deltaproteobacteria bacterium]
MANAANPVTFSFTFVSHPEISVQVLKFSGQAALNSLYRLSVTVLVPTAALKNAQWSDFFATPGSLTVDNGGSHTGPGAQASRTVWTGILTKLTCGIQAGSYTLLELELVPSLGLLAGQIQNRIHLDLTSLDVIKESFKFGGLAPDRYRLEAQNGGYPQREFVFQYDEDLLDFVLRTMQFEGLGLYFDQTQDGEVAVITDSSVQFPPILDGDNELNLTYVTASGLNPADLNPVAFDFRAENQMPPGTLLLKDYNWEDPNRPLEVLIEVSERGRGEIHLYGENFTTEAEGRRLGNIRKEEFLTASESCFLATYVPGFKPGLTFTLSGHPWGGFNDRYLTVRTDFSGSQAGRIASQLGLDLEYEDTNFTHHLTAVKLSTQYRPQRTIPRKKIAGSITAWIDGAGSGQSPEIDGYGRYKILLPLDISGRGGGKASAWIRMAQPYVGSGYGQNFPLTPGAEVLLTFVDGNPDRPVIAGAVANAETNNVVNSSTRTFSGLGTKGGSSLLFSDDSESQKMSFTSGSDRGAIVFTSKLQNPTNALIQADDFNIINFNSSTSTANKTSFVSGTQHVISVDSDSYVKLAAFLQTIKVAYDEGASLGDDQTKSDKSPTKPSAIATKAGGVLSLSLEAISKFHSFLAAKKELEASPVRPHSNLVSLLASGAGAKSALKSKIDTSKNMVNICMLLGNLVTATKDADTGHRNYDDYNEYADHEGDYSQLDAAPTGDTKFMKRFAVGLADGSKAVDVIAQFLSEYVLLKAMGNFSGPAKGILIHNSDSYVNIKSNDAVSVSGYGPAIIESAVASLGDVLRHGISEDNAPTDLLKPEVLKNLYGGASTPTPSYKTSKTVLINAELARTRALEISLQSFEALVAKSGKQIQLIAGVDEPNELVYELHRGIYQNLRGLYSIWYDLPDGPDKVVALGILLDAAVHQLGAQVPVDYDPVMTSGILLKTIGGGNHITLQTTDASNIELIQNGNIRPGGPLDRRITLAEAGTTVQEGQNTKIALQENTKAVMQLNAQAGLTMESASVKLALNPNSCLTLGPSAVNLKNSVQIAIQVGANKMALDASGITHSVGAVSVKISSAAIMLG